MFLAAKFPGCLSLVGILLLSRVVNGAPPLRIGDFAAVGELETEIQDRFRELEPFLTSQNSHAENLKRLKQVASMLAVAAQALIDHEDDSKLKAHAPDLREGATQIARAEMFAEAELGWRAVQAAVRHQSPKRASAESDWSRLVKQRPIMEEMEVRMLILQRALRRPKDAAKEAQHAAAVAVAGLTTLADTHDVKDRDRIPEWEKHAKDLLEQLKGMTAAIKSGQSLEAQAQFKAARAICVDCHRQFKKEY